MKVGTDPEYILMDSSGKCVPSVGLLGHDKDNPLKVPGGAILEDGVTIELNVDPATTPKEFVKNINKVKHYADSLFYNFGLTLNPISSVKFKEEDLQSPQAQESGCDPDFCIYNKSKSIPNSYPSPSITNIRYAGGHIHIEDYSSVDDPHIMEQFINYLDLYIAIPLNFIKRDTYRSAIYGKPGTYRPKKYGLEYRSPDNTWLISNKSIEWAFTQVLLAKQHSLRGALRISPIINSCILTNDRATMKSIIADYNISLPAGVL